MTHETEITPQTRATGFPAFPPHVSLRDYKNRLRLLPFMAECRTGSVRAFISRLNSIHVSFFNVLC